MDGVLILDKPEGPTSFAAVARVRRVLRVKKAGHTGTLDPMATGVLAVCLGEATKLVALLTGADKEYEASARLGASTDTQDRTGKVIAEAPVGDLSREAIEAALAGFRGPLRQVPPMFSAVRVGGRRLHELARAGETVEREARDVVVHALELVSFEPPELRLRVRSSKGTYVRTLVHDLGEALGCHARLTALRRTASGFFRIEDAVGFEGLSAETARARVLGLSQALGFLPEVAVEKGAAGRIRQGQRLGASEVPDLAGRPPGQRLRLTEGGALVAVADWTGERLDYQRVFARQGTPAG